jgi:hypothetical protein
LTNQNKRAIIKVQKQREVNQMKFRVYFENNKYFPTYFTTKKAAVLFQEQFGGVIQRKIGGNWCNY